jgi:hypothetical protein
MSGMTGVTPASMLGLGKIDRVASSVLGFEVSVDPDEVRTHSIDQCRDGNACAIHNPSHHMRSWPMTLRLDKSGLVERRCEHGIGHPDPDSLAYFELMVPGMYSHLGIHGCDGCCHDRN